MMLPVLALVLFLASCAPAPAPAPASLPGSAPAPAAILTSVDCLREDAETDPNCPPAFPCGDDGVPARADLKAKLRAILAKPDAAPEGGELTAFIKEYGECEMGRQLREIAAENTPGYGTQWLPILQSGDCPAGYPVKTEYESGLYHEPGSPRYPQLRDHFVTCFKSDRDAEAVGWEQPKQ